ncbi:uncharacterized protein LOC135951581 [Calliphora vicina]|uniref:uncharacterized protein LOC135951581 n=1 Tax=Calliphora vicina TaxID=7373 RepID=UPI00325C3143
MSYKIYTIFMVLFLTQAALGKSIDSSNSVDSSEEIKDITPKQSLLIYAVGNFLKLGQQFAEKAFIISRDLLKDESLMASEKPEILEFKKNITMFVEKYETNKETEHVWDLFEIYTNATEHYMELPEEKSTPESKFIVELLTKYKCKELETEFVKAFESLLENFMKMFEEAKLVMEKPVLDWYKKFVTITDFEEKLIAFGEFIELV